MVSEEQLRHELIAIYSKYLIDKENKENKEKAYKIYTKYFNAANTLFKESISKGIWGAFNLYEGKLDKNEAKETLKDLQKKES